MGTIKKNAIPDEYRRRFNLSSLWDDVDDVPAAFEGIIFLKKIFELTNTRAEPKAQRRPIVLEADTSNEHANMTPTVRGRRDR
jgi:hypothetical protein